MSTLSESAVHREMLGPRSITPRGSFIDDLAVYATEHHAQHWRGTFAEFLEDILPKDPGKLTRSSHQYIYDMLCAYRDMPRLETDVAQESSPAKTTTALFSGAFFTFQLR